MLVTCSVLHLNITNRGKIALLIYSNLAAFNRPGPLDSFTQYNFKYNFKEWNAACIMNAI